MTDLDEKGLEAAAMAFCVALEPHEFRADRGPKGGWILECAEAVDLTAAVFAAIRAYVAAVGEPVAWLSSNGSATTDKAIADTWRDSFGLNITPLYAAPQPSHIRDGVAEATAYAERLARSLHDKHFASVTQWAPLSGDLIGLLTQIDNMTAALSQAPAPEWWRDIEADPPPEGADEVLGYQSTPGDNEGLRRVCWRIRTPDGKSVWFGEHGLSPTQWMPLPTPPKEGQSHD